MIFGLYSSLACIYIPRFELHIELTYFSGEDSRNFTLNIKCLSSLFFFVTAENGASRWKIRWQVFKYLGVWQSFTPQFLAIDESLIYSAIANEFQKYSPDLTRIISVCADIQGLRLNGTVDRNSSAQTHHNSFSYGYIKSGTKVNFTDRRKIKL